MEAEYSVELGRDDAALEFPWAGDGKVLYYDLKRSPELLEKVPEASVYPEMRNLLRFVNSPGTPIESAKCDVWSSDEITPEEEIFGAKRKFGSYVDLLFSDGRRFRFADHEELAKRLVALLGKAPEIPASAQVILRRCYYLVPGERDRSDDGFYITLYLSGFGNDEQQARQQWGIALNLAENALRQVLARPLT